MSSLDIKNSSQDANRIYPLHMLDTRDSNRKLIVSWLFRFNDVLDAKVLHDALLKLVDIGDWRKLGGRLRLQKNGQLELHVPNAFTTDRPAIQFTHDDLRETAVADHDLASQLPAATENTSFQAGANKFHALAGDNAPHVIEDLINIDRPIMSLHITSFSDSTLVNLTWPHVLMDAAGQKDMLHAWSLALSGKVDQVPPVLGSMDDVIWKTAAPVAKEEKPLIESKRMSAFGIAKLAVRFAWEYLRSAGAETKTMFIPKAVLATIHSHARSDAPDVSENDALIAWFSKNLVSGEGKSQHVTIINAVNARYRLPEVARSTGVYIQNMILASFTFLSPKVASASLGEIAATQRQCVAEQTSETETVRLLRLIRKEHEAGGEFKPFFGDPSALIMIVNNASKVELLKAVDFSSAVVGSRPDKGTNPPGTPIYYHLATMTEDVASRNIFVVYGKDHDDGLWASATLLPRSWDKFEEAIAELS